MNKKTYKSIATFHNIYSGDMFLKKMYNKGLAKMDYIISISEFVKDEIIKKYKINHVGAELSLKKIYQQKLSYISLFRKKRRE